MTHHVEYSIPARRDVERLFGFLLQRDKLAARRALHAIQNGIKILELFPFNGRMAEGDNPMVRELVIPFGNAGYVALYAVRDETITILAIRHQFEDDYL